MTAIAAPPSEANNAQGHADNKPKGQRKRIALWDNMRASLILLVVFGHLLERFIDNEQIKSIYQVIYVFHMPAFIFISGLFARFDPRKHLRSVVMPYVIFQTIYLLFISAVLEQGEGIAIQFTTPYWLLWYLMALMFYHAFIPFLLLAKTVKQKISVIAFLSCVSLLVPFDGTIGYYLSLVRVFHFMPFFATGLYLKDWREKASEIPLQFRVLALAGVGVILFVQQRIGFFPRVLYGVAPYSEGYGVITMSLLIIFGFVWILALVSWLPCSTIPFLTALGGRTLSVYLLHGFVIQALTLVDIPMGGTWDIVLLCLLVTCVIAICFGNSFVAKLFALIFK